MQILNGQLRAFGWLLSIKFKESNLNKAAGKTKYIQLVDDEFALSFPNEEIMKIIDKKSVNTDFLKLFKAKTKNEICSIGFHFYFLDKASEDFKVSVSVKIIDKVSETENFHMSSEMSVNEFKNTLVSVMRLIDPHGSVESIMSIVRESFPAQPSATVKRLKAMSP